MSRRPTGRGRLLQFLRPPSDRSTPHTPADSSALHLQGLHAFHGLRRDTPGSAPACPLSQGVPSRGGRIHLMLRTGQLLPPRGFRRWAPTPGVSPRRRQPATGLPDDYPDRTLTGWRTQACEHTRSRHQKHLLPAVQSRMPSGHAVQLAPSDHRVVKHPGHRGPQGFCPIDDLWRAKIRCAAVGQVFSG
jgi:hypothetical protein